MKKIVITGFGAAGYAALSTFKRLGNRDEITIIDPKSCDLMHPCGLPYVIEKKVKRDLLVQNVGLDRSGVRRVQGTLTGIRATDHYITVTTGKGDERIMYDSLILSTGASPVFPPIKNIREYYGKGVFTLSTVDDLDKIISFYAGKKNAVVIGAGAIGLESAFALRSAGLSVTVLEAKDQILPGVLDPDMASAVRDNLDGHGIRIKTSFAAEAIGGKSSVSSVRASGEDFEADICILAAGFIPNIEHIRESGIQCDKTGIIVDDKLRSSEPDIYAAGDCSAVRSIIDGGFIHSKLATSAYKQGVVAAQVISGIDKHYNGSAGTFVSVIGENEVAGTGFNSGTAKLRGFDPVISKITSRIHPDYFENDASVTVKIIADRKSGKILGAQCIGARGSAERVNIISAALEWGISLEQLERIELAYCPAVSEVYDPLSRAIDGLIRRIKT